ncbi:hypothetical protein QBC39DRAFT_361189 [Podospora conica]|nr:hypothetical protein QBC39DRAFT_361189 [Schizothecium conicum]
MAEAASHSGSSALKAPKDRSCPYCHQPFTSSSLGRHLDLYIKERNPKAPDGIHNVEEIRKIRCGVTRRHPRRSLAPRDTSTSVGTPTAASRKSPTSDYAESWAAKSPVSQKQGQAVEGTGRKPLPGGRDITASLADGVKSDEGDDAAEGPRQIRKGISNRHALKQQHEARRRYQHALDTARASELALREIIGSLRATKREIDATSMPFNFDPLSLDFPALTLQCLEPPPTLFSSTQTSTPTSWSLRPPGLQQLEALRRYFEKEFRGWKAACVATASATSAELASPSPLSPRSDGQDAIRRAEKVVQETESLVYEHLQGTFDVWAAISPEQRAEVWILELARSVVRKQREAKELKQSQQNLEQENANLKLQLEQQRRSLLPAEFNITPPTTILFDPTVASQLRDKYSAKGACSPGLYDSTSDINAAVSGAVDKWRRAVVSARAVGLGLQYQRPLGVPATGNTHTAGAASSTTPTTAGFHMERTQSPNEAGPQGRTLPRHPQRLLSPLQPRRTSESISARLPSIDAVTAAATASAPQQTPREGTGVSVGDSNATADSSNYEDEDDDMSEQDDGGADIDADGDVEEDAEGDAEENFHEEDREDADEDAHADHDVDVGHGNRSQFMAMDDSVDAEMGETQNYGNLTSMADAASSIKQEMQAQHSHQQHDPYGSRFVPMQPQQPGQMHVPRTRDGMYGFTMANNNIGMGGMRSVTHGGNLDPGNNYHLGSSIPAMPAMQGMRERQVSHADMSTMQNVVGEPMYMD